MKYLLIEHNDAGDPKRIRHSSRLDIRTARPRASSRLRFAALCCCLASNLLASPAMSPKQASQVPPPVNVPLAVQQPMVTFPVQWLNPRQPVAISNLVIVTCPGSMTVFGHAVTNTQGIDRETAIVTAPSNSTVYITSAAIGIPNAVSVPSSPIVMGQTVLPPAPLTNVQWVVPMFSTDLLNWQKQTNQAWKFTTPGYWRLLTATNL